MPRQPPQGDVLSPHGELEADVVEQDSAPRDEDARGGEVDEPVEDGQGAAGEGHEAKQHEDGEQRDADVGGAPARRAQEDAGRLLLEREAVQDAGAREQALVGRGPGRRDDDGVDDRGDGLDAGGRRGDDEGALRRRARGVAQPLVVARHEHAHDKHGQDVEDDDARKDALAGPRDRPARALRLGRGHGDGFHPGEGEDGARHHAPVSQEPTQVARGDREQFYEGTGFLST